MLDNNKKEILDELDVVKKNLDNILSKEIQIRSLVKLRL